MVETILGVSCHVLEPSDNHISYGVTAQWVLSWWASIIECLPCCQRWTWAFVIDRHHLSNACLVTKTNMGLCHKLNVSTDSWASLHYQSIIFVVMFANNMAQVLLIIIFIFLPCRVYILSVFFISSLLCWIFLTHVTHNRRKESIIIQFWSNLILAFTQWPCSRQSAKMWFHYAGDPRPYSTY